MLSDNFIINPEVPFVLFASLTVLLEVYGFESSVSLEVLIKVTQS